MDNVIIAAGNEKGAAMLVELIQGQYRHIQPVVAGSGSKARRLLLDTACDLLLISAPLTDESGVDLAAEAAQQGDFGVMLLIKAQYADEISARVDQYGVFVVEKPLHAPLFYRALKLVETSTNRLRGKESEKLRLQDKLEEIRLVDRAKCVLIQYLSLSEPQAHRYIEKQAMDMRMSKREVAQGILKTYET